jgi:hypothetical protein
MPLSKFIILCGVVLISLAACRFEISGQRNYERPLQLEIAEIPGDWIASGTEQLYGWGVSSNAYILSFATPLPERLLLNLRYLQYSNKADAHEAYVNYSRSMFGSISSDTTSWYVPYEPTIHTDAITNYKFQCKGVFVSEERTLCVYWAQYENCIIGLSSHIQDFTLEDMEALINQQITPKMERLEECHAN